MGWLPHEAFYRWGRSGDEDDLARVGLAEELLLGLHDLAQREGLPQHRLDLATLDVADEIAEYGGVENRAAEQAEVPQIERAEIERHHRPGNGAGHGVAAAALEDVEKLRPLRAAHDIDDDVRNLAPERTHQIGVPRNDPMRAEGFDLRRFRSARDGDDMRAATPGELHGRRADAAGRAGDQHRLTGRQIGSGEHVFG